MQQFLIKNIIDNQLIVFFLSGNLKLLWWRRNYLHQKRTFTIKSKNFWKLWCQTKKGENGSYICTLIRHDLVEEFISHVHRTNISLSSQIKTSIFETNSCLIENKNTSLIEYSAFLVQFKFFDFY